MGSFEWRLCTWRVIVILGETLQLGVPWCVIFIYAEYWSLPAGFMTIKKNLIYRVLCFPSQKRSHFTGKSPLLGMIVQLCKLWAFHGLLLLLSSDCSYQNQHFIFLNMSGLNVIHHNSHSKLLCHLSDYLALILALFSGRGWRPNIVWGSWMAEIILTVDKDLAPANRASIPE